MYYIVVFITASVSVVAILYIAEVIHELLECWVRDDDETA